MVKLKECKRCLKEFKPEYRNKSNYCPECRDIVKEKRILEETRRHNKFNNMSDNYKIGKFKMF